jgi:hypothetical protein
MWNTLRPFMGAAAPEVIFAWVALAKKQLPRTKASTCLALV